MVARGKLALINDEMEKGGMLITVIFLTILLFEASLFESVIFVSTPCDTVDENLLG